MKTKTSIYHRTFAFAYVLLVAVIFFGCETKTENETIKKDDFYGNSIKAEWGMDVYIRVVEIDSCEYIVSTRSDAINSIHKQNCKFCSERSKK